MTLVLLVLAVIWAFVLIPPALRARAEGRPADSISAFKRQLAVLRRTGPRSHQMAGGSDYLSRVQSLGAPVVPMTGARPLQRQPAGRRATGPGPVAMAPRMARSTASAARQRTLRRRRDVLVGLASAAAVTLVLGAIPSLRIMWAVHLVVDALLMAYVAMLIHQRNVVAERDMKVRFLPGSVPVEPALLRREPALLRRSGS